MTKPTTETVDLTSEEGAITLNIRPLGGTPFKLTVTPNLVISDLRKTVSERLGGGHVRLLCKGKQLTNGTVSTSGLTTNTSITVIRSSKASVDAVRSLREDTLLRGLSNTPKPKYTGVPKPSARRPSLFGTTRALPQYADWRDALAILDDLATHPGFHAAMSKRHWNVGLLAEMAPTGKVGVDPVCVLGYNVNKGMEIHLRLRTDDELGFRPIYRLYEVLAHELAHCEHSDHGEEFKQLMLDIQREAEEGDWRYGTGRVLGNGGVVRNNIPGSRRRLAEVRAPPRRASAARSRLIREHDTRRVERIVAASVNIPTKSAKCACEKRDNVKSNETVVDEQSNDIDMKVQKESTTDAGMSIEDEQPNNSQPNEPTRPPVPKPDAASKSDVPTTQEKQNANPTPSKPRIRPDSEQLTTLLAMGLTRRLAVIALRMTKNDVTAALDWALSPPVPNFGLLHSTAEATELRTLLDILCTETPTLDDYLQTLETLHIYLSNMVLWPTNQRYRSINGSNGTFTTRISPYPSAINFLRSSGFTNNATTNRWTAGGSQPVHTLSSGILLERLLSLIHE